MKKFIFVSGGVISGIGKGITSASVAFLLKSAGYKVTMIKADPYLNVDAGTMNPLEHGETFVLEDGFETDMDIGTYERFIDESFSRQSSMTLGAVLQKVIKDERSLAYDGKWVSLDYHVPEVVVQWIKDVANREKADITIVEIGGTVGEVANGIFLEANRMMKVEMPDDVIHLHVSYLPVPGNIGEMKSKTVQISVKVLHSYGINPDMIFARAEQELDSVRIEKLSRFCSVNKKYIISSPDISNIYEAPLNFEKKKVDKRILKLLKLVKKKTDYFGRWEKKIINIRNSKKRLPITIVGKYYKSGNFDLKDSYVSVIEAVDHAAWKCGVNVDLDWLVSDDLLNKDKDLKKLQNASAIIVPQGWGSRGVEGKIKAVEIARTNKIPYLGLCFGMQMAVIEYARNVLNLKNANSEEVDINTPHPVIHIMKEQKVLLKRKQYGGTIRLGAWPCKIKKDTVLESLYKNRIEAGNTLFELPVVMERHRHRYEFNNQYREELEKAGLIIAGTSPDNKLVEAIELPKEKHPFFIGTQYHPELKTRFLHPHPIFVGFIKASLVNNK